MVNQEKGHKGKNPVLALRIIINTRSSGGTRNSASSGSPRTVIMVGRTITVVPIMFEMGEKMP